MPRFEHDGIAVFLPDGATEADVAAVVEEAQSAAPSLIETKAHARNQVTASLGGWLEDLQSEYPGGVRQTFPVQEAAAIAYSAQADATDAAHLAALDALLQGGETRADRTSRIMAKAQAFRAAAFWAEKTRQFAHSAIDASGDQAAVRAALSAFRVEFSTRPTEG